MKLLQKIRHFSFALFLVPFIQNAQAEHDEYQCKNIPKEEIKSQQELHKKLTSRGWRVRQIKVINGCYEVYGFDEKNARVEIFFDPRTLELVPPLAVMKTR